MVVVVVGATVVVVVVVGATVVVVVVVGATVVVVVVVGATVVVVVVVGAAVVEVVVRGAAAPGSASTKPLARSSRKAPVAGSGCDVSLTGAGSVSASGAAVVVGCG